MIELNKKVYEKISEPAVSRLLNEAVELAAQIEPLAAKLSELKQQLAASIPEDVDGLVNGEARILRSRVVRQEIILDALLADLGLATEEEFAARYKRPVGQETRLAVSALKPKEKVRVEEQIKVAA